MLKPIKISKTDAIEAALAHAQGKATARTITLGDILCAAESAERKLNSLDIPKKYREGCRVEIRPAKVANSYKYRAEGSYAYLVRGKTEWMLKSISRGYTGSCSFGSSGKDVLVLSDMARANIPSLSI